MNTRLLLCYAALSITAPVAGGATLSYASAYRYIESGPVSFEPADPFADLDMGLAGLDSIATQRSALSSTGIVVSSRIAGSSERGAAFFKVNFSLNEPGQWSLTGSFELLGTTGLACVSILNLARPDLPLVNEIIYGPPPVSATRMLNFGGVLAAGNYTMEAMIYGGGDDQLTRGGIDAMFTIPEPAVSLLLIMILPCVARRR